MKQKGLFQAASVAGYCLLVGFLMFNANAFLGQMPSFLAPVTVLLLFSTSALVCALLVFYRPYILFFGNKKKEAIDLVLYTAVWLFVFFIIFLLTVVLLRK